MELVVLKDSQAPARAVAVAAILVMVGMQWEVLGVPQAMAAEAREATPDREELPVVSVAGLEQVATAPLATVASAVVVDAAAAPGRDSIQIPLPPIRMTAAAPMKAARRDGRWGRRAVSCRARSSIGT